MRVILRYFPFFAIPAAIAFALIMAGCSSSTTVSNDQNSVTMQSQLTASDVSLPAPGKDNEVPSGFTFNKIVVTRAEVFIKDVKLHSDKDDSTKDDHDQNIKTGPMVLIFDSLGAHTVTTTNIPSGNYDRIKFEIHKPDKNNSADSAILAQFPEFRSGNQTYTVVIKGYMIDTSITGTRTYFTVYSAQSANRTIKFEDKDLHDQDKFTFSGGATSTLLFEFDPRLVFHVGGGLAGSLFDPRSGQNLIDNHVLFAIRVVKM